MKGHKELKRAKGGSVEDKLDRKEEGEGKVTDYSAPNDVEKDAKERKKGGRVKEREIEGKKPKHSMGRPGRKAGGRVGSDTSPFSSAHGASAVKEHKTDE